MSNNAVLYTKKDHVGRITLNRPEVGNIFDLAMKQELDEVCSQINRDEEVYVVVLTGAGEAFCLGREAKTGKGLLFACSPAEAIAAIDCPVLAALNGDAIGEGLELALACDLRLASDRAKFSLPQISGGLIPTDGGTQRLSRIVGKAKALEMVLTGEIITAQSAFEIGLVNKLASQENLISEAEAMAKTIALKAPLALRYCKEAVNKGLDLTLEQGLRLEADLYFLLHTTSDRTEGVQSFLQKRTPNYEGK